MSAPQLSSAPASTSSGAKPLDFNSTVTGDPLGLSSRSPAAQSKLDLLEDDLGGDGWDVDPARPARRDGSARQGAERAIDDVFDIAAVNPLVAAASTLLWLAGRLNESAPPDDMQEFRGRVMSEIRRFESAALARDVPTRLVRVSAYVLCAVIDDIILNTEWGVARSWASASLVSSFYDETWGGERFYELLEQLERQPERNIDALELMAICLALGFSGKYRVADAGHGRLMRVRHDLYRTIRRVRGPVERTLSNSWRAAEVPYVPVVSGVGLWWSAGVLAALLLGTWLIAGLLVRDRVERVTERIRGIAPSIALELTSPVLPDSTEPVSLPTPPVLGPSLIERITTALAADIAADRITVLEGEAYVLVRMNAASFPSAGTALADGDKPLVDRIAAALEGEWGRVLVIGHTDNIPMAAGNPIGDNLRLSRARAEAVADLLRSRLSDPGRVSAEGRGENDPIASNATPAGRAANRRVEIQIETEPRP